MRRYSIYRITNKVNGKIYIGKTEWDPFKRYGTHIYKALKQNSKLMIHSAIRKYGPDNFDFDIIFQTFDSDTEYLNQMERYFIKEYNSCILDSGNNGYNMTRGGDGNDSEKAKSIARKLVEEGRHQYCGKQGSVRASVNNKKKVAEGRHHFQGSDVNQKMFDNGIHPSQTSRTCPHCNKTGKGGAMMTFHFDKCKFRFALPVE